MPFKKIDPARELNELNKILDSDPELKRIFDAEQKEFEFRINLARARREQNLTQNDIKMVSGLTQQAISRIEKGSKDRSPTLRTLIRYVDALDYDIQLVPRKQAIN